MGGEVGAGEEDELFAHMREEAGGVGGLEEDAADADHGTHEDGGDEVGVRVVEGGVEGVGGGGEEIGEGEVEAAAKFMGDAGAVDIGADGVEGGADAGALHFGVEEGTDDGGDHDLEGGAAVGAADVFDGLPDVLEVLLEGGLEEGAFIGKVLVEGADGDAGAGGDAGGGEALLADTDENLKGGFEDGGDAGGGAGLDGRFSRSEDGLGAGWQMRTPNLKLASSKHTKAAAEQGGCEGETTWRSGQRHRQDWAGSLRLREQMCG